MGFLKPKRGVNRGDRGRLIALLLTVTIALSAIGCSGGSSSSGIPARISFEDRIGSSSMGAVVSSAQGEGDLLEASADSAVQRLEDFYTRIGTKHESYTPTKFRLFIQEIVLYNENEAIELDVPVSEASLTNPEPHMADFVNDIVLEPSNPVPPGTYTGMFFFFFTDHSDLAIGGTPENPSGFVTVAPEIEVTIPGYEGVWPDDEGAHGRYEVKELSGGAYRFTPAALQPSYWANQLSDYLDSGERMSDIQHFAYIKGSDYRAILPGMDGFSDTYDTSDPDTLGLPNYGSNGNASAVVMPFDGVEIPSGAKAVSFRVQWDLDGIIEVYDNGTASDKTDDVVVLAKNFWQRFSLVPEVR